MKLPSLERDVKLFFFCLFLVLTFALIAHYTQNDSGNINVSTITIIDESGQSVTGKLYRPMTATADNPLPGVLLLHGFNNDKDTEATVALELARRGIVAFCIDELSHGDSGPVPSPLLLLGGVNYTLGANSSYNYLKSLPFVDGTEIGLVGHSMGGSAARTVALMNPDHRAIVIQAGGPDNLTTYSGFNNYLDVWPYYEELFSVAPRAQFVNDSLLMIGYNEHLGTGVLGLYDHTYGAFSNGSAHRYALCPCTHPGSTWNSKAVTEVCAWMLQSLSGLSESQAWAKATTTQTYMILEYSSLTALVVSVLSLIPLANILLKVPYFQMVAGSLPTKVSLREIDWWKYASLNTLIGGATFIIIPMVGLLGGAVLGVFAPIFLLATGNGSVLWLLVNFLLAWLFYRSWFKKASSQDGLTYADVGRFESIKDPQSREIIIRTIVLATLMFGYLYAIVTLSISYLGVEFRYMWPVFKMFTPLRFGQFLLYIIPVLPFFLMNGGVLLFGMLRQKELKWPLLTQIVWWLKGVFAMEAGLLLVFLIQYLPMYLFGTGPVLGSALGLMFGLYGIFLMQILPWFAGMFFIATAFYRRTGRIYLGTIMVTILTVWLLTVSSALV